jgi:peroxiredoxin
MTELGELEAHHAEFDQRDVRIIAASLEGTEDAKKTQADFPHLTIVADRERGLANVARVIHPHSAPDHQGDTSAPTTVLIDGSGKVHWVFRPERVLVRLSPHELLAAVDQYLPAKR